MDRYVTIGDYKYDRLLSKWAIYREGASKDELVSHARYANVDKMHVKQSVEAIPLKSKKGLGGLINHSRKEIFRILTVAGHIILMRGI